jgi:hypothetical protein
MGRNAAFKMRLSRKNRKWRDFANFDELGRFGPNGGDSQKKRAKTPQYSTTSRITKNRRHATEWHKVAETRHGMAGDTPRNDTKWPETRHGMGGDTPRNGRRHATEWTETRHGMAGDTPRNDRRHATEWTETRHGMAGDTPRNDRRHATE